MSWAEIKKSLNSDPRTPLDVLLRSILSPMETNVNKIGNATYGLEAIKTAIDNCKPWYPSYGTGVTLKSLASPLSVSPETTGTIFTIVAPEDGEYRIDFNGTVTNNSTQSGNSTSTSSAIKIYVIPFGGVSTLSNGTAFNLIGEDTDEYRYKDNGYLSANGSITVTGTYRIYMRKGMAYKFTCQCNQYDNLSMVMNSFTVKYTKNQ